MEKEDKTLKKLIQEGYTEESPSMSFAPNIMRVIETKKAANKSPLIGKIGWLTIGVVVLGLLGLSLASYEYVVPDKSTYFNLKDIGLVLFIVIVSGLFIVFDNYLRRRKKVSP